MTMCALNEVKGMKLKMKEKTKNIILLVVICVFTLALLFVALRLNNNIKKDALSSSDIKKYLTEIKYEEISTHVIEQPSTVIYVSNSSDDKSRKFEKEFKKVVKKYNLENEIIYININDVTIVDPVYQYAPELVFYKDGEISDIIDCTILKNSKDIIKELVQRGIIND